MIADFEVALEQLALSALRAAEAKSGENGRWHLSEGSRAIRQ
jgi:hypothetical protein